MPKPLLVQASTFLSATLTATILMLGLFVAPPTVLASTAAEPEDPKTVRAKEHFKRGESLHKLGRYAEAIKEFEEGYILAPLPAFLLNIAQSARLNDDPAKAKEFYVKYLDADPESSIRAKIEGLVVEMDKLIAEAAAGDPPVDHKKPSDIDPSSATSPGPTATVVPVSATPSTVEPKKKKGSSGIIIGIVVGVVVAAGAATGITLGVMSIPPKGSIGTIDVR